MYKLTYYGNVAIPECEKEPYSEKEYYPEQLFTAYIFDIETVDLIAVPKDKTRIEVLMAGEWFTFIYNSEAVRLLEDRINLKKSLINLS